MSDLFGNPEDQFSHKEAHMGMIVLCLCLLLTASGNLFRNMKDSSFLGLTHMSDKISRWC